MLIDDPDDVDAGPLARTAQEEQEFAAALRLRNWVKDLLDGPARTEWRLEPGALDNVFVGTFGKGTKTYRAALLLADRGYAQQAEMLNRSLFEHTVVAWWLLLCTNDDEEVMQSLRDHRAHAGILFERALADLKMADSRIELAPDEGRTARQEVRNLRHAVARQAPRPTRPRRRSRR